MPPALTTPATTQVLSPEAFPTTAPATLPAPLEEIRSGDLIAQTVEALQQAGVTQTFLQTHWWQWTLAGLAIFLGLLAGRIVSAAFHRWADRSAQRVRLYLNVVLQSIAGPIGLFLFMVGLAAGLSLLAISPALKTFLIRCFQLVNIYIIGWLLYGLVELVALALLRYARGRQGNLGVMLVPAARKTLRVMLVVVLTLFAVENVFDQDVKALLAGLGIAGLAVSLAAQDSIRNLFGSVMIFADQPFAIGDRIKVTDQEGTVVDIGFRSTRLRTADGYLVTIPNANIAGAAVVNYSRRKTIRRTLDLTLAADTPLAKIQEALAAVREALADPDLSSGFDPADPPTALLDDAGALRIRIQYTFGSADERRFREHAERLNLGLLRRLREIGVSYR